MTDFRLSGRLPRIEPDGPEGGSHSGTQARREGGLFVWAEFRVLVRVGEEDGAELLRLLDESGPNQRVPGGTSRVFDLLTAPERADEPGMKRLGEPAESPVSRQTTDLACPARLTGREVQVLKLIAAGRSNQRIAEELMISMFTVARHVSNIFDKTGAANRAEAAVFAARHDLL